MENKITLSIQEAFDRALNSYKEGKLNDSFIFFKAILEKQPTNVVANYHIALILSSLGKYDEALMPLKICIKEEPNNIKVFQFLIKTLIRLGLIYEARKYFDNLKHNYNNCQDQLMALHNQINPERKLDFFYRYLQNIGIFDTKHGEILEVDSKPFPLLTNTFLNWFETQSWSNCNLLELGSGSSTLYFSSFFKSITSYETNQEWYSKILKKVNQSVNLKKVNSILESLENVNINDFDVILIDAGENRAKLSKLIVSKQFKGIIFHDNAEWYRNSINILTEVGYIEIPFFGIKPVDDHVASTSVLVQESGLSRIFSSDWKEIPKFSSYRKNNSWDQE